MTCSNLQVSESDVPSPNSMKSEIYNTIGIKVSIRNYPVDFKNLKQIKINLLEESVG